jgi:RNA polymerase sigma factor (sigma-70 family)
MNDMVRLIQPVIPGLRRYAHALLRDRAEADDLVQDCLERAISRWHQRRPEGDARSWLFTILHNLAINRMRQRQRRGAQMPIDDAGDASLSRPPTQEDALQQRDILRALAALPEEQRSVVLLVSVESLPYAEVATMLDIPIGTVMSRLARGREKLRRAMECEPITAPAAGANLRRVK